MYAAGAAPLLPEWAAHCGHWPGVHCVKTLDDGFAWQRLLAARPARAVVVGGGYIGVEAAEGLAHRGVATTLVTRSTPMSASLVGVQAQRVREGLEEVGVTVVVDCPVEGVEQVGAGYRLTGSEGRVFDADVVALALGVRPRVGLAQAAGLTVAGDDMPHAAGALVPDERQQVRDGVWAAGDCCAVLDRLSGQHWYVPLGTHANKAARVAGTNIGGGSARFGPVVGTAITRAGRVEVARTGLMPSTAAELGLDTLAVELDSTTASGYMPQAAPMHVWVLGERGSGRLLGCQITGGAGAGKRIDVAATALTAAMTADEVAYLDLAYCPPFSPTWDPVQIACRKLAEAL
jgi:NADPH-dependent 2,4-dienoyl-CoA reductase/sulfur reductase-like enzyme